MDEWLTGMIQEIPATVVLCYLLYMVNSWGKALLEAVSEIKGMLEEQTRAKSKLSEAAPAKLASPWRADSR